MNFFSQFPIQIHQRGTRRVGSSLELLALRSHRLFQGLADYPLHKLSDSCELVTFKPGEHLKQSEEPWNAWYFIVSGKVLLQGSDSASKATLSDGGTLGESALFHPASSKSIARVIDSETSLVRLSREKFLDWLSLEDSSTNLLTRNGAKLILEDELKRQGLDFASPHLDSLCEHLETRSFQKGELVSLEPGKKRVLLIHRGRLAVLHEGESERIIFDEGTLIEEVDGDLQCLNKTILGLLEKDLFQEFLKNPSRFSRSDENKTNPDRSGEQDNSSHVHFGAGPSQAALVQDVPLELVASSQVPIPLKTRLGFFPGILQQSLMDCGAACLQNVCAYFGKDLSLSAARNLTLISERGTTLANLKNGAEKIGFTTQARKSNLDEILNGPKPIIANWQSQHWVVVMQSTGSHLIISDPARGKIRMNHEEFREGFSAYALFLNPTSSFLKVAERSPTLHQFRDLMASYRFELIEIIVISVILQVLALGMPIIAGFGVDRLLTGGTGSWLYSAAFIMLGILGLSAAMIWVRDTMRRFVGSQVKLKIFDRLLRQVLELPVPFFETRTIREVTERFRDIERLLDFFFEDGLKGLLNLLGILLSLILIAWFHPWLATLALTLVPLHILSLVLVTPRLREAQSRVFDQFEEARFLTSESLDRLETLKILGLEYATRWKWEDSQMRYRLAYSEMLRVSALSLVASGTIRRILGFALLVIGSMLVLQEQLSIGGLVSVLLVGSWMMGNLLSLEEDWEPFLESRNTANRIEEIFDQPTSDSLTDPGQKMTLSGIRGNLQLEQVSFRYDPTGRYAIRELNLEIRPEEKVAILGLYGSGTSTLLKIFAGIYQPQEGRVFVDGFDIADLWLPSLRRNLVMLPSDDSFFPGTIRENLEILNPSVELEEIIELCRELGIHQVIHQLEMGYETQMDPIPHLLGREHLASLALIRLLIAQPRVLLIDHPFLFSETAMGKNILNILVKQTQNTLIVTNPLASTLPEFQRIFFLQEGRLEEEGSHEELITREGLYHRWFVGSGNPMG